jgi:hypothetical protein
MHRLQVERLNGLGGNKTHFRPLHGLRDGLGVPIVVLLVAKIAFVVLRRYQSGVVPPYGTTDQDCIADFLEPDAVADRAEWIITNPPFNLASAFTHLFLERCGTGSVAMLVRIAFLEPVRRYSELFLHRPPTQIFQFTERVRSRLVRHRTSVTSLV